MKELAKILNSQKSVFYQTSFTLYLAQAITSLKRKRWRSLRCPSDSSTIKEFFTRRRWALSADCQKETSQRCESTCLDNLRV